MSIPVIDRRRSDGGGGADGPEEVGADKRRRPELLAGILAFTSVLAGALTGIQIVPARYAATSVISFMPRPSAMTSADTVQLLSRKYVVLATSATIMQTAGDAIRTRPDELELTTTASLDAGTGNLGITVARPDPEQAVDAANAVAEVLVRRSRYDDLVEAEATSPAVASRVVSRPARLLLRSAAGVGAVLAGILAWTLVRGRSPTGRQRSRGPAVAAGAW